MLRLPFGRQRFLLGVDISDASVEIVVLEQATGVVVRACERVELPVGVVHRGVVQDEKKLTEVLRGLRERLVRQGVRAEDALFALPEEFVYARRFSVPATVGDAWRTHAATAVADSVPYERALLVWDARVVLQRKDAWDIVSVATPRALLATYTTVLRAAGFRPRSGIGNAFALAQAYIPHGVQQATLIADIGTYATILSLFDARGVYASTVVEVGGETLTQALATQRHLSVAEAEEKKRAVGFLPDADSGAVFLLLQKALQPLVQEAEAFMAEYETHCAVRPVHMILAGGTALLPGIGAYLSAVLDVTQLPDTSVTTVRFSSQAHTYTTQWKQSPLLYVVAMGLASYGFLPREQQLALVDDTQGAGDAPPVSMGTAAVPQKAVSWVRRSLQYIRRHSRAAWIAGVVMLIVGGVGIFFFFQSTSRTPVVATAEKQTIVFPLSVALRTTSSVPDALVGRVFEVERGGDAALPLLDARVGVSTGTIQIRNTTAEARVFPAGFLLRTASGTVFALRDAVTVPARKKVSNVAVVAQQTGDAGDIQPQEFAAVDQKETQAQGVVFSNKTPFSGGATRGTVSADAYTHAVQALEALLFAEAEKELAAKKDGSLVYPTQVLEHLVRDVTAPPVGMVDEKNAVVHARVLLRTVGYTEAQLRAAAEAFLRQRDGARVRETDVFSDWQLGIGGGEVSNGVVAIPVTVSFLPAP